MYAHTDASHAEYAQTEWQIILNAPQSDTMSDETLLKTPMIEALP